MKSDQKNKSWLFDVVIGILIIAAGIFLLVSPKDGKNDVLKGLVGIGVFLFCVFNIYRAVQTKNDNRLFIPYLVQGLLDIVLLLLLITIPEDRENPEATLVLVSIIIACWMMVFGFFEIIHARIDGDGSHRLRNGALLMLTGVGVLVIPLLLGWDSAVFIGIAGIFIGIGKTVQGLLCKVRSDEHSSGGRSNLF
jgi:uncharacterized membrane protein HdeD (DUF308 family)